MKIVFGTVVLSAGAVALDAVSGLQVNGQQINDELQFIRAAAVSLRPRGNRTTSITFSIARPYASLRAAARALQSRFSDLPEQAALYLWLGTAADGEWVRYDDAVLDQLGAQQVGQTVYYHFAFRAASPSFESSAPDTPEPDNAMKADSTPIPSGDDEVAVVFASPFATTPRITGLFVTIPSGGDSIWAHVVDGSVTVNGFTAQLSAPVPSTGYKLTWSAL